MAVNEKISPLQLHSLRALPSGMTESQHLSNAYLTAPEKLESVLAYAFGTQNASVLPMLTGGIGNTRFITNREYTWELHNQVERAVEVTSKITVSDKPGYGGTVIQFGITDDIFSATDVIVSDNGTQIRIQDISSNGYEFIITAVMMNPNTAYLEPSQIAPKAKWSKDYSTVEEFSTRGGGTDYQAPAKLHNQLTTIRKEFSVSRSAATDVMIIDLYAPDGTLATKMWTRLAEWTAMAQWYKEQDRLLMYSEYNSLPDGTTNVKGDNNRPVYAGAGVRQQISPSNRRVYYKLTYDLIYMFLLDLSFCASRWGGNHNFVALTGKMGIKEFDDAIRQRQSDLGITVTDAGTFINGSGNELTFEGNFSTVKFINNITLTVKEFPLYDDIVRNRTKDPATGKPIESSRFTILNFGFNHNKGYSNIRKVAKVQSDNVMWYESGSIDPTGIVKKSMNMSGSNGIDGYRVNMIAEIGIQIQDPTSCGELVKVTDKSYI